MEAGAERELQLSSATNPKSRTVSYTYNSNNLLASKTDAKGQTVNYSYDGYNRLSSVSSGGSVLRSYYYDANPCDPNQSFSHYTAGRLAAVVYGSNWSVGNGCSVNSPGAPSFAEWYSYVQPGTTGGSGVAVKRLQVGQMLQVQNALGYWNDYAGYLNLDAGYTYNNEGGIASVSYPATYPYGPSNGSSPGPSYTYSFDVMARPSGLTDQNNTSIVNTVSY